MSAGWRETVAAGSSQSLRVPFARNPDGSDAWFPLVTVRGARPGPVLAITAGIHGDEYEGPKALHDLLALIRAEELSGTLLAVPIAHLAAFAAATRTSPVDGLNLARIFPGDPGGTITQRLAWTLFHEVITSADLLVDLHSGGTRLAFAGVAGFYGDDHALARDLALPYLWRLPERDGVLSFEAHRRGILVAGCEAGGRGGCLEEDRGLFKNGLLSLLRARGMLAGEVAPTPSPGQCLDGDWQLAPVGGLIENHVGIGDRVEQGRRLATIRDPFGQVLEVMAAPFEGIIMGVRHACTIQPGEWATCVVQEVALP